MRLTPLRALPLVTLMALGAGCASAPSPTAPGSAQPAAPARPSPTASSGCDNPYYPLKPGYSATFQTNTAAGPSTFTQSVTASTTPGVVTMHLEFGNDGKLKFSQDLDCSNGDIKALGYMDLGSAASGMKISTKTKKASGVLMPANISVGKEWDNAFDIETTIDNPQMRQAGIGSMNGTVSSHQKVVREESVTVPAGTYDALVIESSLDNEMTIGTRNVPTHTTSTAWWVKGVGMVKSVTGNSTLEATSITLP